MNPRKKGRIFQFVFFNVFLFLMIFLLFSLFLYRSRESIIFFLLFGIVLILIELYKIIVKKNSLSQSLFKEYRQADEYDRMRLGKEDIALSDSFYKTRFYALLNAIFMVIFALLLLSSESRTLVETDFSTMLPTSVMIGTILVAFNTGFVLNKRDLDSFPEMSAGELKERRLKRLGIIAIVLTLILAGLAGVVFPI
ncbi:hypothetical protein [Jeotgalibacillus sp. R-1-5s-1]|uniref:hypothetical protein n=1 Tax=Jeotgalibacillus sp. R-1-5s-1 TaxID=2555897 RepID=UPI0010697D69|nr:hypothetical protein [Jeotgalibacillus sp. R-1-5s-1]TFD98309.1 hypothetical protein E2491_08380 [Jeotgalibacillus sp. R-1-5s-1]